MDLNWDIVDTALEVVRYFATQPRKPTSSEIDQQLRLMIKGRIKKDPKFHVTNAQKEEIFLRIKKCLLEDV